MAERGMKRRAEFGDVAAAFQSMNQFMGAGVDRTTALGRLVALAVLNVPGCSWASVTEWPVDREPRSLACSDPVVLGVDEIQHALGEGPCLDVIGTDEPACIPDLMRETRWPRFCQAAFDQTEVRGVLAFRAADPSRRVVLNLFSSRPSVFGTDTLSLAALFAAHTRVLVHDAGRADDADKVQRALVTSRQVGVAIGILMNTHHVSEETAFAMLRRTSQALNVKLPDVAADVTRTGRLPG